MSIAKLRKNIRLPSTEYRGKRIYFLTICCKDRLTLFLDKSRARIAVKAIGECALNGGFLMHAYCVMPDHVHLLVEGKDGGSDVLAFVKLVKQRTAILFREVRNGTIWQRSFHDHILRDARDSDGVAWYIWMNPVRKGLARAPWDYEFLGSGTVEWPPKNTKHEKNWLPPWRRGA